MDSSSDEAENQYLNLKEESFIFKSICEEKNIEILYSESRGQSKKLEAKHKSILSWNQFDSFQSIIKDVFLPKGYPYSVSSDYLEYQFWDTCQAFCSSISGTLSMSAVMEGVGVGSQTATPVSAAITWIMKDGTGMLGSILFAWSKGSKLDSDCKKWRLFADVLNDVAMCLELFIPLAMHYSMYILCLSTAIKALVGVAGSATRAALTCHQAIQGNMADVSAKDGSQEIFVNLCAYIFGIFLLKSVTEAENYLIIPYVKRKSVLVSFRKKYSVLDVIKAYFHAALVALAIELSAQKETLPILKRKRNNSPVFRLVKILKELNSSRKNYLYKSRALPVTALVSSDEIIDREFSTFCQLSLDEGWRLDKHLIIVSDWRAEWKYVEEKRIAITEGRPSGYKRSSSRSSSTSRKPSPVTPISYKSLGYGSVLF